MQQIKDFQIKTECPLCRTRWGADFKEVAVERQLHWSGAGGENSPVLKCYTCSYDIPVEVPDGILTALLNKASQDKDRRKIET